MSKHTPGPWCANRFSIMAKGSTDTYSGTVWGCIARVEELYAWDSEGRGWSTSGDRDANAHLIAAAPELLEALEIALDCAGDAWWAEKAEAAIAKAKGE